MYLGVRNRGYRGQECWNAQTTAERMPVKVVEDSRELKMQSSRLQSHPTHTFASLLDLQSHRESSWHWWDGA